MEDLKIVWEDLDSLVPYEGNAKVHTNRQIDAIQESISELDFTNPIVAWHNEDGIPEIVAGHARALAAQKSGIERVPVIYVDHLTDAQRRALVLVDNQTAMMTGFNRGSLKLELEYLKDDYDAEDFGFDPLDLADLEDGTESIDVLGKEEIDAYADDAEADLLSYNVMIRCRGQEDIEKAAELFGFDPESPRRFYRAEELMGNGRA